MSLQERIQIAARMAEEYSDLIGSDVGVLRHDAQVRSAGEISSKLEEFENTGRLLQVGIIGKVKAGKSSLLNALFFNGEEVLPKAATPMTAALTTLTYGDAPSMRAELFSEKDLAIFHSLYDEFEKAIDDKELSLQDRARQASLGRESPPPPNRDALAKVVASEDKDIVRQAGWQAWREIKKTGRPAEVPDEETHACQTLGELRQRLKEYVGAGGARTPFTKCLHLTLPIDSLRNLKVVDTPGLNDPVRSRDQRTRDMLADCDAIFIVSSSGQFLSKQDEELMERLATREGLRTIYTVASQFDLQLFGMECQSLGGDLRKVIDMQRAALARHARNMLSSWSKENSALASLAEQGDTRLRISSSAAHALLQANCGTGDESAAHADKRLRASFPDHFSADPARRHWLETLSGIPQLSSDLADVRDSKQEIFSKRRDDFLAGQKEACDIWVESLLKRAQEKRHEFETTDILGAETKLKNLADISVKGSMSANDEFSNQVEDYRIRIRETLKGDVKKAFKEAEDQSENATGSETESREKSGVGNWLARKLWGGGYESYKVETVNANKVRRAIDGFRDALKQDLTHHIDAGNRAWRDNAYKAILKRLREDISDDNIKDPDGIRRVVRAELVKIADLSPPTLPDLPEELSATGTLKGGQRRTFMDAAEKYMRTLQIKGADFVDEVDSRLRAMQTTKVGSQMFRALQDDAENLKQQIQAARLTAERYDRLLSGLKEIRD